MTQLSLKTDSSQKLKSRLKFFYGTDPRFGFVVLSCSDFSQILQNLENLHSKLYVYWLNGCTQIASTLFLLLFWECQTRVWTYLLSAQIDPIGIDILNGRHRSCYWFRFDGALVCLNIPINTCLPSTWIHLDCSCLLSVSNLEVSDSDRTYLLSVSRINLILAMIV